MFSSCFYKCLLKFSIIIILLECTIQTQAVEDWSDEERFNTGRKLMEKSASGGEIAVYVILFVLSSFILICCRIFCRHPCFRDDCECGDDTDNCDGCCSCDDDHSLTNPSHTATTWPPPVQQQPRQFNNFGTLSPEPNTLSFHNTTYYAGPQNTATVFAQDSSNLQAPQGIASAPPLHNFTNTPGVPQPYNAPSESHIYSIPSIPTTVNSVNADYADPPPAYSSVVLGDLLGGNGNTQFPSVVQEK